MAGLFLNLVRNFSSDSSLCRLDLSTPGIKLHCACYSSWVENEHYATGADREAQIRADKARQMLFEADLLPKSANICEDTRAKGVLVKRCAGLESKKWLKLLLAITQGWAKMMLFGQRRKLMVLKSFFFFFFFRWQPLGPLELVWVSFVLLWIWARYYSFKWDHASILKGKHKFNSLSHTHMHTFTAC